ncbi:GD19427 [Drosophila simulans]|uniref:GD19427 n=1 Tax=Drosophila simulans TaxID=7240 RepID=B4R0F3_DROSI|nr:GD19427 [Drosophila simulans]
MFAREVRISSLRSFHRHNEIPNKASFFINERPQRKNRNCNPFPPPKLCSERISDRIVSHRIEATIYVRSEA